MEQGRTRDAYGESSKEVAVRCARVHLNGIRALARNGLEQLRLSELHLLALETSPGNIEAMGAVVRAFGNLRRAARRLKLRDLHYYVADQERLLRDALDACFISETAIDASLNAIDILKRYFTYVEEGLTAGHSLPSPQMLPALRHSVESLGMPTRVASAVSTDDARKRLGELLMASGDITEGQLQEALFEYEGANGYKQLGELLLEELLISREQLTRAIALQEQDSAHPLLGEVLVKMGVVSSAAVNKALDRQRHPVLRHLGEMLVWAGRVPAQRVVAALRRQGVVRDAVRYGLAPLAARFAARATDTGHPQQRNRFTAEEGADLARFREEARELLAVAECNLLALESAPEDPVALDAVRRSIRAVSRFACYLGLADLGRFARAFLGYVGAASQGRYRLEGLRLDVAFDCVDVLRRHLGYVDEALERDGWLRREKELPDYIALLHRLSGGKSERLRIGRLLPAEENQKLGDILVSSGQLAREALDASLAAQTQAPETVQLGDILVDEALVSHDQIERAVAAQQDNPSLGRLGDILVQWGLIERSDIQTALSRQRVQGRSRIGELLVRAGAVSAKTVAHALRRQRVRLARTAAAALVASTILAPAASADAVTAAAPRDSGIVWVMDEGQHIEAGYEELADVLDAALVINPTIPETNCDGVLDGWEFWDALNRPPEADATEYMKATGQAAVGFSHDQDWDAAEGQRGATLPPAARLPSFGHSRDTDARAHAAYIQCVVNAALGLDTPVPANISPGGLADALDIQSIIKEALGIQTA